MVDPEQGFDGRRQREVLQRLRTAAGLEIGDLPPVVGLSYPQVVRYLYGQVPLRAFQLPLFAKALGVDPLDLLAELGGEEPPVTRDSEPWTFRDALRGHLPEELIERLAPNWEQKPLIRQRAAVEALLEAAAEARADATKHLRQSNAC